MPQPDPQGLVNAGLIALVFGLAMFGVLLLAATHGGRNERASATLLGLAWTLREALARARLDADGAVAVIDIAVLLGCLHLLRRDRSAWLFGIAGLQVVRLAAGAVVPPGLDSLTWLSVGAVQAACVMASVARRQFGPPYPVPSKNKR